MLVERTGCYSLSVLLLLTRLEYYFRRDWSTLRLPAADTLKRYSKALEYEYRVKTVALGTLKRYYILSLTLYLE
jgi:hypothetical protein